MRMETFTFVASYHVEHIERSLVVTSVKVALFSRRRGFTTGSRMHGIGPLVALGFGAHLCPFGAVTMEWI